MNKVVGIFSAKGGVGKTTCALNMALAVHDFGSDVMVLDCDLKNSNLALHLGLYDFPLTLQDVLEGDTNFLEAVYIHSSGLRIIPASISPREFKTEMMKMKGVLNSMDQCILLDTPAGMNDDVRDILQLCNEAIVVTTPDIPSLTDSMKTIQMAKDMGRKIRGIIVNRVERKHEIKVEDIEKVCGLPVLGVIPEDRNIKKSIYKNIPVIRNKPNSDSSIAMKQIAAKLIERDYSPPLLYRIKKVLF